MSLNVLSYLINSLSFYFIRKNKDKVDWELISKYQTLSENFYCEFKDKINWLHISQRHVLKIQELSDGFIDEFQVLDSSICQLCCNTFILKTVVNCKAAGDFHSVLHEMPEACPHQIEHFRSHIKKEIFG